LVVFENYNRIKYKYTAPSIERTIVVNSTISLLSLIVLPGVTATTSGIIYCLLSVAYSYAQLETCHPVILQCMAPNRMYLAKR
jgi:hypothetical protein